MNGEAITSVIFIYTTGIILKGLRDSDRTSEWASLVKLVHHIVFAPHMAILINSVYVVFIWNCTCTASCTVPTESHRATLVTIVPTSRLVDRAGFISDIVLMNPFVSIISITSITPIIFVFTWDKNLRRNVYVWPSRIPSNFNSIRQCRRCSMSPTRSAILRNVLISYVCKIAYAFNLAPVPISWKITCVYLRKFIFDIENNI
jgi:hypothetical protein